MAERTIREVLEQFLEAQAKRVKPRTMADYRSTIELFQHYLNGYAYQYLSRQEEKVFDRLYDEAGREFCDIFGPDKINASAISEFLDWFVIRKVIASQSALKAFGRVMKKLTRWLTEEGYWGADEGRVALERASELAGQLPRCEAVASLIYEYIQNQPAGEVTKTWDSYFTVTKVEPGKLWLEDFLSDKSAGAVKVSQAISGQCQVGWRICLLLGKTSEGWKMLESGNVYPE